MSYNYGGDHKQQPQPYPGAPSRNPTTRTAASGVTTRNDPFDSSGAGTRMNSFDPYSATSSRQQLNDGGGMRYRDDAAGSAAAPPPVDTELAGGGVRRSASRWSPTTPMSRCVCLELKSFTNRDRAGTG